MIFQIPQGGLLVQGFQPQVNTAEITGDYISMKTAHRVWVVFHMTQANAAQSILSLSMATAVLPTGATPVVATFPIWYNLDCTTDIFTRAAADAASYTLSVDVANKLVIFQIDPSIMPGYDCLAGVAGASNIANIVSCIYIIDNRYKDAVPPSVIID